MNCVVYKGSEIPNITFQYVSDIFKDACREREQQGIHFTFGSFGPEDIKVYYYKGEGYLILAQDEMRPIGALMAMLRNKGPFKYVSHDYLGIIEAYKGKGIATMMFRNLLDVCNKASVDCITSATNINAITSVNYHCKNGFKIYLREGNTYGFIYPINKLHVFNYKIFRFPFCIIISGIRNIRNALFNKKIVSNVLFRSKN